MERHTKYLVVGPVRALPTRWRLGTLAAVGLQIGLLSCTDRAVSTSTLFALSQPQEGVAVGARTPGADVTAAIRAHVVAGRDPALGSFTPQEREELISLYSEEEYSPRWIDTASRASATAHEALALLEGAAADGLDLAHYGPAHLDALRSALDALQPPPADVVAQFDVGLSLAMVRYFRDLHIGRVDPRAIGFNMTAPADVHDFGVLLRSALADHRITETAAELMPPFEQYADLRRMLGRYRSLAADTTLEPLAPPGTTVRPGDQCTGLRALHQRLVALGDLPADAPPPMDSAAYDGALVEGVKRFQIRHGLDGDGVLGSGTQAALRVPLAWRVRQIELALERLRWLPRPLQGRLVAVNIPMFHLWVWDSTPLNGPPSFGMAVIVGRALNTRTPVFVEEMRYAIFRPYWNVPRSILRGEILPAIERDPGYLAQKDMEVVSGPGDLSSPVPATADNLAQLRDGLLRVRQRPGPANSLGLVKFVFPNDDDVYMHGTPAPELFRRPRRDFSHGCVRVEDPVALAEWAFQDQPEWTRDRILAAMQGTGSRRVNLTRPIQVILFYITAIMEPEDGRIRFAEDIYGHDAKLDSALALRRSTQ
jgi:L,D-transpeptidase YcbB